MKHAIVMGASSGIGFEIAQLLLENGWRVAACARREERLSLLGEKYGARLIHRQIDITSSKMQGQLLELAEQLDGVDLYFHVAGVGWNNPDLNLDKELLTVETNGRGFVDSVGTMFRYMSTHGGGHIAAITSIAGTKGLGPAPAYSATKAMQNTYLQALVQLSLSKNLNITITDIRPGFVNTDLLAGARYPMMMNKKRVARKALSAALKHKHVVVIDFRYAVLTTLWRLLPRWIWRRINLVRRS